MDDFQPRASSSDRPVGGSGSGAGQPTYSDRFVPSRSTNNENVRYLDNRIAPTNQYEKVLADNMLGVDATKDNHKVLKFSSKAPEAPETHLSNGIGIVCNKFEATAAAIAKPSRVIPSAPLRALDAPGLVDDYYSNAVDWSRQNMVAIALGGSVYLWNGETGQTECLCDLDNICAVKWTEEGMHLAVSTNTEISLWDVNECRILRKLRSHAVRSSALAWKDHLLSAGSKDSEIHNSDVRVSEHLVGRLTGHEGEVCGIGWSQDGQALATGANDNTVKIWDAAMMSSGATSRARYSIGDNTAAIKAVAWCPFHPSLLATGAGTADRRIRLFNANTGNCVMQTDTKSQVCAIQWSTTDRELISGHGYSDNQLSLWKYPSLVKVSDILANEGRTLGLCLSPDGTTVLSASADEILRFWRVFSPENTNKQKKHQNNSCLQRTIR